MKCHECGKLLYHNEVIDSKYCNECAEVILTAKKMSYSRCTHCRQFFPQDNMSFLGKINLIYCDACATKAVVCKFCGDIFVPDKNENVCSFCYETHSRLCVECKRSFLPEKRHYNTCPECYFSISLKKNEIIKNNFDEKISVENKPTDIYSLIESFANMNYRSKTINDVVSLGYHAINPLIESLDHENDVIQNFSIQCLVAIGDVTVPPLIDGLEFINDNMRANCANALGKLRDERAVEPLINVLENDYESFVRCEAADALGIISNEKSLYSLIKVIKTDKNPNVKVTSVKALGNIDNEVGLDVLIESLSDENNDVIKASALSIVKMKGISFLEEIMDSIESEKFKKNINISDSDGESNLKKIIDKIENENLILKVTDLKNRLSVSEEFIKNIIALIENASDVDKICLIDILGEIPHQLAIEPLINCLSDDNTLIRWSAKESLEKIALQDVNEFLQYLGNENGDVRYVLVHILTEIGDNRIIEPLINTLYDPDPDIRYKSFDFFSKKDDEKFIAHLPNLIIDENVGLRIAAIKLLGKKGDEHTLEALSTALSDDDFKVRREAKKSIRIIKKRIGKEKIKEYTKKKRITSQKDRSYLKKEVSSIKDDRQSNNPMKLLNDLRSNKNS